MEWESPIPVRNPGDDGRQDPARAGTRAGRAVGLLTAGVVVVSLLDSREHLAWPLEAAAGFAGLGLPGPLGLSLGLSIVGAALGRYALCYVVGSLLGVVYDQLGRPSLAVVAVLALLVGVADAALTAGSVVTGLAILLAWLCFVPLFARAVDDGATYHDGPVRVNRS